ncbi:hypothetical protein D3C75_859380 [compost metagenome]
MILPPTRNDRSVCTRACTSPVRVTLAAKSVGDTCCTPTRGSVSVVSSLLQPDSRDTSPRQTTNSGRINVMQAPCLRANDSWDATVSVDQGSINGTDRDQAGIFGACAGLFAGMPAPTGKSPAPSQCCTCGSGRAREEAGTAMHELLPYSETISHPVPPLQPLPFKRRFNFKIVSREVV